MTLYSAETPDEQTTDDKIRHALEQILTGTEWGPPSEMGGIITDAVISMGWRFADGKTGESFYRIGTRWGTRGLIEYTQRCSEASDESFYSGITDVDDD